MESKTDPFSFKTQGANYQQFRPKYPANLLNECHKDLPSKVNYLDVATGTGQVLFDLANEFTGQVIGSDVSETMVKVALEKATELTKQSGKNIQIVHKDCLADYPIKFDLITVGEALHWFSPPNTFLSHCKHLLTNTGKLSILAYVTNSLEVSPPNPKIWQLYKDFFTKMKQFIPCDLDEIERLYAGYAFEENFADVRRVEEVVKTKMRTQHALKYFRTYSGYNMGLQRTGQDLLVELEKGLQGWEQVTVQTLYFGVYCTKPIL